MDTIAVLHRRAHLIEQALDDLDTEERLSEADPATIKRERQTLGRLLAQVEDRLYAAA